MPAANGASGPTIVRLIWCSFANLSRSSWSASFMGMFLPYLAVPGFPGAMKSFDSFELWDNFRAIACSRPPDPINRIFILAIVTMFLKCRKVTISVNTKILLLLLK